MQFVPTRFVFVSFFLCLFLSFFLSFCLSHTHPHPQILFCVNITGFNSISHLSLSVNPNFVLRYLSHINMLLSLSLSLSLSLTHTHTHPHTHTHTHTQTFSSLSLRLDKYIGNPIVCILRDG